MEFSVGVGYEELLTQLRELDYAFQNGHVLTEDGCFLIERGYGIKLECRIDREYQCTDACHRYGFHDGRRAFATHNAANRSREALRVLMRHASEQTTAKYINYAQQLRPAAQTLHIPAVLGLPASEPSAKAE